MAAGWVQVAVRLLVGFFQVRLVIQYLDDGLAGTWFLFLSLAGYIGFFDLGVSPTLSREIGFALGRRSSEEARQREVADLLATTRRFFRASASLVFVLALPAGAFFLQFVAPEEALRTCRIAWCVLCFGASVNLLGNAAFASLYGLGSVSVERSLQAVTQLAGLGLLVLAIGLDLGLVGIAAAWTLQGLVLRALGWFVLHRLHPWTAELRGTASRELGRKLTLPSLKWMLTSFGALLILNTDNVLIASVLGADEVPAYHAVGQMVVLAMQLSLLVVTASTPFVSRAHAAGDHEQVLALLMRNVRYGMGLMVVIVAALFVHGDLVIELWIGPGRFVGLGVLTAFLVMLLLETHHRVHATVVMARGDLVFHWVALLAGVLNLVISLILMRRWGLLGVALGTMLAQLLTNNWFVPWYAARRLRFSASRYLLRVVLPLALLLIAGLAAGWLTRASLPPDWPAIVRLLIGVAATGLVSLGVGLALLVEGDERRGLLDALRSRS